MKDFTSISKAKTKLLGLALAMALAGTGLTGAELAPTNNLVANTVSKNGTLLLNLSPKADGTFPPEITRTLLAIGQWLKLNGEAVYDTHNWIKFAETDRERGLNIRFTVKGDALYAILLGNWPEAEFVIKSLASGGSLGGDIANVSLLGSPGAVRYSRDETGLKMKLSGAAPCQYAYVLKITGLKMNPPTWTDSGNPQ